MRCTPPPKDFFIQNRKQFMEQMLPNSIAYFRNADVFLRNGDVHHVYRCDSHFYYLTGIDFPDAHLILDPENPKGETEILLIPPRDPQKEVWFGKRMDVETAKERTGIACVEPNTEAKRRLFTLQSPRDFCYINTADRSYDYGMTPTMLFIHELQQYAPELQLKKARPILNRLREKKQPVEIDSIKTAISITKEAFEALCKHYIRPGVTEYELEAQLSYEFIKRRASGFGYEPIIASGAHAAVLHYIENASTLESQQMILLDIGAEYGYYSADITRTVPVDPTFHQDHKEVYQRVLDVQHAIMDFIKPGKTLEEVNAKTDEWITDHLIDLHYITERSDFKKYYMHRFGHHLGLDVHDVMVDTVIKPGNVLTVEPGIYAEDRGFGIRIEDDILVTETGIEVLSQQIPKTIAEIEALRQ